VSTPVVLVHGAFHGPWCWERVTPLLDAAGVPWIAPELFGPDLHADADTVRRALDTVGGDAVVVGHSYGGAVVTDAGDHPSVAHVVYLAALALDAGETLTSAGGEEATSIVHESPNLGDVLVANENATITLPEEHVGPFLYGDCDEDTVAWAASRVRPQPLGTFAQSPRHVAWRVKPSTYVVCTKDRAVHPDLQRVLAKRCGTAVEWESAHSPFASMPRQTAELLIDLAR
jgi:pimeloyl-ACP methyl ester carboxylesterase